MKDKRCGDCLFWRLERDKKGEITGHHWCDKWNGYKTAWQDCVAFYIDKTTMYDLVIEEVK